MAEEKKKLFVSNIDFEVTREQLRDMFEEVGPCVSVVVATDRETKRSRGFAFVEMENDADANLAVEKLNNNLINNRPMKVTFDKGKAETESDNSSTRANFDSGSSENRGRPEFLPPIQRIQIFKPKKRVDPYSTDENIPVDFKDIATISTYVSDRGKILPRRMTGLTAANQRKVAKAIKKAQSLGLMPYTN